MPPVPLLFGLLALGFVFITWQVVADGPLLGLDERLSGAVVHPDRLSELLADLGNVQVAVPVLALTLGYVAWRRRAAGLDRWWLPPAAAAVLMAVVPALIVPLKELVARPGPRSWGPAPASIPRGTPRPPPSRTAPRRCSSFRCSAPRAPAARYWPSA